MTGPIDLVAALSTARRAVQLYPPTHPSHREAIVLVVGAVHACCQGEGVFVLNVHEGRLYAGSQVIASDVPSLGALAQSLERHRIESLTFDPAFGEPDAVALAEVLNLRPAPDLEVAAQLAARGVTAVGVGALADGAQGEREERDRRREQDHALYRQLVSALRAVHQQTGGGGSPNLAQAQDLVGAIMSRLLEDNAAVLGMATLNARDDSALFHSINVMIYSLTLGLCMDLPEDGLLGLGIAALLHDVGKVAFDMQDPAQARAGELLHPRVGAEILSRLPGDDPTAMLVAYEHHMGADGSGHPERPRDYVTHPYSRIVAVADRYENLTKTSDGGEPLTPDRAVMRLLSESRRVLDPLFTRLFVKALGVFPIGCVVRLSDQSVGVVRATTDDLLAPVVRVLYDDRGLEVSDPLDADLRTDNRTVVEVVDPASLSLQVADRL
jgi:HD-GYP domain-containing protein (c-di-GMP phosphodiesterase class II)